MSLHFSETCDEGDLPIAVVRRKDGACAGFILHKSTQPEPGGKGEFVILADDHGVGSTFEPMPELRPGVAWNMHAAAPQGAGKSSLCNIIAKNFKAVHGGKVVVFSADGSPDPALTAIDKRIEIGDDMEDLTVEAIAPPAGSPPMLLVMDDTESIAPSRAKGFQVFSSGCHTRGRKAGVHTVNVFHRGANHSATASSLGESTHFAVWPSYLTPNICYMIKTYAGVDPSVLSLIKKSGWGHYLIIRPGLYLLGEKKAAIYDEAAFAALAKAQKKRLAQQAIKDLADYEKDSPTVEPQAKNSVAEKLSALHISEQSVAEQQDV